MPERVSFPAEEEKVLKYWTDIDAFKTSLKQSEGKPEYVFFDGPPFATGNPHYGHILAGTIKDIRTRYAHQTGHHVPRRFGWDCHGLPIEFEIEKMLGIKTKAEVLELGIDVYNEHCRSIVMRCSDVWKKVVPRMGRWIDFENDYKTMDVTFMESVWWVFKQLFDKDLIYRGFKARAPGVESAFLVNRRARTRPLASWAGGAGPGGGERGKASLLPARPLCVMRGGARGCALPPTGATACRLA